MCVWNEWIASCLVRRILIFCGFIFFRDYVRSELESGYEGPMYLEPLSMNRFMTALVGKCFRYLWCRGELCLILFIETCACSTSWFQISLSLLVAVILIKMQEVWKARCVLLGSVCATDLPIHPYLQFWKYSLDLVFLKFSVRLQCFRFIWVSYSTHYTVVKVRFVEIPACLCCVLPNCGSEVRNVL